MLNQLTLRQGTLADYGALSHYHYRSARPATATRIWVFAHRMPTAGERFTHTRSRTDTPVAVLVESLPALACAMRDHALCGRYVGVDVRERAKRLNREVRCISRVVVHPRWRGLGLAVQLVKHALATASTPYTEALAAMGHVHPFFEQAGMEAYPPTRTHRRGQRALAPMYYIKQHRPRIADAKEPHR